MNNVSKKRFYSLLILCFVLLSNPNVSVIDIMPDFIAWFILARLFTPAADSSPYFEEARAGFVKLGWINVGKILGFMLIIYVKGKDSSDNNIFPLVSFAFLALELIYLIPALRNVFNALFYLGERTEATALISPLPTKKQKAIDTSDDAAIKATGKAPVFITVESVRDFTYFFFIVKTVLYFLPDMFLLSKTTERGYYISISKEYPGVLLASLAFTTLLAVLWFRRIKKYVNRVYEQDKFLSALKSMQTAGSEERYETRLKQRSMLSALTLLAVSTILSIEVAMDNWSGINILPPFIYGSFLLIAYHLISKHSMPKKAAYIAGLSFIALSFTAYALTVSFLSRYDYSDITKYQSAKGLYTAVSVLAILELASLIAFLCFITLLLNRFAIMNTEISVTSDRYSTLDKEFHKSLVRRNYIFLALGTISAALKATEVFINGTTQIIFTDPSDVEMPTIIASDAPWFGLIVAVAALIHIGYTFYLVSSLKDEIRSKISDI